jgi:hypothetical protein
MDALNTSDHTLILATVGVDVKRAAPKAAKILTKPRWEKCDRYHIFVLSLVVGRDYLYIHNHPLSLLMAYIR